MHDAAPESAASGRFSVFDIRDQWYVVAMSSELRSGHILSRTIWNIPLVVFRDSRGEVGVLLDACPHRNVPLRAGRVVGDHLQCSYHGWEFDTRGACQKMPGLMTESKPELRKATVFSAREESGFIWVYMTPGVEPDKACFTFPSFDRRYGVVRRMVEAEGTLHATMENALDVPHTAYLHGGLFRTEKKTNEIEVVVQRRGDSVEAEYLGEPRPTGLVARLLSPSGGVVTHFDRFFLPSIAQVEYRIGEENHIFVTAAATPVSEFRTKLYALVGFRTRFPAWLVRPLIEPFALKIFSQDAKVLKQQSDSIRLLGGEQFVSTEIDILGNHIRRLLREAAEGKTGGESKNFERRLRLRS